MSNEEIYAARSHGARDGPHESMRERDDTPVAPTVAPGRTASGGGDGDGE